MSSKAITFIFVASLCLIASAEAGRIFLMNDAYEAPAVRVRRDSPPVSYHPAQPKSTYHHSKPGKVGPVYTFVKTDPNANFKWGVRHVAGVQYSR